MSKVHSKSLTPAQRAELKAISQLPEAEIDTREMPEIEDWTGARRGALYRPAKRQVTLQLDADIVDWLKSRSRRSGNCHSDIDRALREYMARHPRAPVRG